MFEHKRQSLAPFNAYLARVLRRFALSMAIVALSLGMGAWGYHSLGDLEWIDAWLNAAMILTGMGPVDQLHTTPAKLFAVFYCLFSGIVFLTLMAFMLAPVYHRFMHQFHLEEAEDEEADGDDAADERKKKKGRKGR